MVVEVGANTACVDADTTRDDAEYSSAMMADASCITVVTAALGWMVFEAKAATACDTIGTLDGTWCGFSRMASTWIAIDMVAAWY